MSEQQRKDRGSYRRRETKRWREGESRTPQDKTRSRHRRAMNEVGEHQISDSLTNISWQRTPRLAKHVTVARTEGGDSLHVHTNFESITKRRQYARSGLDDNKYGACSGTLAPLFSGSAFVMLLFTILFSEVRNEHGGVYFLVFFLLLFQCDGWYWGFDEKRGVVLLHPKRSWPMSRTLHCSGSNPRMCSCL